MRLTQLFVSSDCAFANNEIYHNVVFIVVVVYKNAMCVLIYGIGNAVPLEANRMNSSSQTPSHCQVCATRYLCIRQIEYFDDDDVLINQLRLNNMKFNMVHSVHGPKKK